MTSRRSCTRLYMRWCMGISLVTVFVIIGISQSAVYELWTDEMAQAIWLNASEASTLEPLWHFNKESLRGSELTTQTPNTEGGGAGQIVDTGLNDKKDKKNTQAKKFSMGNGVFEMTAANNWRKMTPKDWASFGPASTEAVKDGQGFIEYRNVCVSSRDGILVPENKLGYASSEEMRSGVARKPEGAGGVKFTPPSNPKILPKADKHDAYLLSGTALLGCCWRQIKQNPSHWMFGHGPLFTATTLAPILPTISHVIFHQCATTDDPEWALAKAIENFTDKRAYEVGLFPRDGANRIVLAAPRKPYKFADMPSPDEALVCVERLLFRESIPSFFGIVTPQVIEPWRREVDAYVSKKPNNVCPLLKSPSGSKQAFPGCNATCSRSLRVAVWQRADRLITNVDKVAEFLARYTDEPVERLTANVSMIFTPSKSQVFVEIQAMPGSDDPGCPFSKLAKTWARGWVVSYGHLPVKPFTNTVDKELTDRWDACLARVPVGQGSKEESYIVSGEADVLQDKKCNMMQMRRGAFHDRLVNLEYLRDDFEAAVRTMCGCKPRGGLKDEAFRCGATFLPEERLRKDAERRWP